MTEFKFKKKYGQNFLQDKNIINNIVSSISPNESDLIIEIGPGGGALTSQLKKYNANILAYEIDNDAYTFLYELIDDKTSVIFDDFLKRNIKKDLEDFNYSRLFIVGNLPYYITTPIIQKIIDEDLNVTEMVFMIQDEVADRFSAKPKSRDYGSISVFLNYFFEIKKLFVVGRKCFYPIPNVDSAVIKLTTKQESIDVDRVQFSSFVRDCFQFKRKNLRNNLKKYNLEKIDLILKENGYSLDNRAEDLPYEVFVDIVKKY